MLKAYPEMGLHGVLRQSNADFRVTETLGFEPSGEGEHVMLWVEKNGANTEWLAKRLANHAGVSPRDVSFAGVKDRHAITQQWFSVWMKNKPEPDWLSIQSEEFKILKAARHARKIKRGTLQGNTFQITLRHLQHELTQAELMQALDDRIQLIRQQGVPNYFGEQRFGFDNVAKVEAWFSGEYKPKRAEQTWLLSSARSVIFNAVLSERIQQNNWQTVLADDVLMLNGSRSTFTNDNTSTNQQRHQEHDVHITGPLYGDQQIADIAPKEPRYALEHSIYRQYTNLCEGLDKKRMAAERRPLRILPQALLYDYDEKDQTLTLSFYLPSGAYATSMLEEILHFTSYERT